MNRTRSKLARDLQSLYSWILPGRSGRPWANSLSYSAINPTKWFKVANSILCLVGLSLALTACGDTPLDTPREVISSTSTVVPISKDAPTTADSPLLSPLSTPEQNAFISPLGLPNNPGGVLAFHSDESGALEVHTLDFRTGVERQLVTAGRSSSEPSWSPDCQHIVFTFGRNDSYDLELFVMNGDGSDQHKLMADQIPVPGRNDWAPAWSPKGDIVAYQTNRNDDSRICFASANGKDLGCSAFGWDTAMPAWSPSGDRLLFVGREDGDWDVFIADFQMVDSEVFLSDPVKLTNNMTLERSPHMSPDEQHIVFESDEQGDFDVMLMRSDGTELRHITTDGLDEVTPSWLGNDQVLYAHQIAAAGWEILTVDVNSGETRTIKSSDALNKWPVWCGLP